jgi:Tfp pilus assembly protein PilN
MRDVDFVPPWYRDLLRRKRSTVGYLLVLGLLVIVTAGGGLHRQAELRAAERRLAAAELEVAATCADLEKLDALRRLRDQWRRQEQVVTSTGTNVEASRLLAALTNVVPPDTALTGISIAVAEPDRDSAPAAAPATAPAASDRVPESSARPPAKRRLNVSLRGVAPGEVAVANVLAGISEQPLFRHVNLTYAKDRQEQDGTVREFEVTFIINLDLDGVDERD